MYGFSEDLDLTAFGGCTCTQVRLGLPEISLCFHGAGMIQVGGAYRLLDDSGTILEEDDDEGLVSRDRSRLPSLLGASLARFRVLSKRTLRLEFDDGRAMEIDDSSEAYETVLIEWGDGRSEYI